MESYEKGINTKVESGQALPEKLDISLLKYFWQASPIAGSRIDTIPKFLRKIDVLKNFSDNELRVLSQWLHLRVFSDSEIIFKQKDIGVGLYFIYSGQVDVKVENDDTAEENIVLTLDKNDYFGELALLQEGSIRNATAVSRDTTQLLGIFKPDVENLIESYPVVATKLLQSISVIVANRLFSVTQELKRAKHKLHQMEVDSAKTTKN
ncbi:MAG: cyclic nucleotide-binding domain-containing protein [Bacteriovoracaceae bacterium]|nr:cyclic nucleotide-binding domain-containing protein [Bacteriovoracaceae bacterium]